MKEALVITFHSTHHALKAERILKEKMEVLVIPIPRSISANCGIALKVEGQDLNRIEMILSERPVPFDGIYPYKNS